MDDKTDPHARYCSPLTGRYASKEMLELFSERNKIGTWRKLWISLAEAQKDLGLDISEKQIEELKAAQDDIDFSMAESLEREVRHDVVAHIKTFASKCQTAGGIIHLGATSCFVADNTDLILIRDAGRLIQGNLVVLIDGLARFAEKYKSTAIQAYTHFQPAQLTSLGKRACLWLQDLMMDLEDLEHFLDNLGFRGVKGTTGTQASFLKLFDGDHEKVEQLDLRVCQAMGFQRTFPVTGQTYPRKVDARLLSVLAGVAASASKFANDIRLLAHERELEEPFLKTQVGSSAMAYKRNPMRCERICSLSRFVLSVAGNPYHTAATQWLERTLDDSAGRRIVIPEAFLATEAVLNLYRSVVEGLVVNEEVIKRNMEEEISFMATENILIEAVKDGGDRQILHEKIRNHALEASRRVKEKGEKSDLLERLRSDGAFKKVMEDEGRFLDPKLFIGRSPEQVDSFLANVVRPLLEKRRDLIRKLEDEVNY